jgi:hypothetical protein
MDEIDGDEGCAPTRSARPRGDPALLCPSGPSGVRRPRSHPSVGLLSVFFIVAHASGFLSCIPASDFADEYSDGTPRVVGIALARWIFLSGNEFRAKNDGANGVRELGHAALRETRLPAHGFLAYEIVERLHMNMPFDVRLGAAPLALLQKLLSETVCLMDANQVFFGHTEFRNVYDQWLLDYSVSIFPVFIAWLAGVSLITL